MNLGVLVGRPTDGGHVEYLGNLGDGGHSGLGVPLPAVVGDEERPRHAVDETVCDGLVEVTPVLGAGQVRTDAEPVLVRQQLQRAVALSGHDRSLVVELEDDVAHVGPDEGAGADALLHAVVAEVVGDVEGGGIPLDDVGAALVLRDGGDGHERAVLALVRLEWH